MHRIAALYDIHGNLPALQAVLSEVSGLSVDLVVFGGDLCWGPVPRETLELIQTVENARFVRGNADRSVAKGYEDGIEESILRVTRWSHEQLELHHREFLAAQPETVIAEAEELGDIFFCHGSPRSDEESITTATRDDRLHEMLSGVEQRIVVCGHTHAQFERASGMKRVVNAGSVGLPFGAPGAYWALLGPDIELRRTDYDYERAAEMFLDKGGPEAQGFAEHALAPPPYETAANLWG
jgi:putative phosphoesterase